MRPILFSIGPIVISSFGFFAALAFMTASFLVWKFSQERLLYSKSSLKDEDLFDGLFVFSLGFLFGARIIFIFSHFNRFGFNLLSWVLVRQVNGFSFLGGFVIAGALLVIFCWRRKLDPWKVLDIFSPAVALALAIGFMGALLDGTGSGSQTEMPWGVLFVGEEKRQHPVQGLAAVLFLVAFLILKHERTLVLKKKNKKKAITLSFLAISGIILFLLAFFQEGKVYFRWLKKIQFFYLGQTVFFGGWFFKCWGMDFRKEYLLLVENLKKMKTFKLSFKRRKKNG